MRKSIHVNPNRRRSLSASRRFTLTEAVVILAVAMVLTAILVPTLHSQGRADSLLQARDDVQRIGEAIRRYYQDTHHLPGTLDFTGDPTGRSGRKVQVLVSGGNTPRPTPGIGADAWHDAPAARLDTFLMQPPLDYVATRPSRPMWRGPYLDVVPETDPWGNCYMVNIGLHGRSVDAMDQLGTQKPAIYILSAGPNGAIDTPYHQYAGDASVRGDDIAHRLQ